MRHFQRSHLCSIYLVVNTTNGKAYVGQTWTSVLRRWRQHQTQSTCRKLAAAIRVHGPDSFRVELLTFASTQEMADHFEAFFIARYDTRKNGYNIRDAGAHGSLSPETRALMSDAHRGKVISAGQREKLRQLNLGKKNGSPSPETRQRISAALLGKTASEETKRKLSLAHLGKGHTPETRAKMSATRKGKKLDPSVHAKMAATKKAQSPEVRRARGQKIWETRRARAAQKEKTK